MFARALSCLTRRLLRVLSVSIDFTHVSGSGSRPVVELHPADEQVAREEGRSRPDQQRIDPGDEPSDPAPGEPARVEALAPEPGVAARLDHADPVPLAVTAKLVRREVADVVRIGRAVRDVRPAPEQQPEPVAPVAAVRLHPDERAAAPEHAEALRDVALEIEEMLQ